MVCADVHVLLFFLYQLDDLANLFGDILIALPFVGAQAAGAVFDAGFGISKIAAAVVAQGVEGAVAEDAGVYECGCNGLVCYTGSTCERHTS